MKKYGHILGVILLIALVLATFAIYAVDAQNSQASLSSQSENPYPGETPNASYPGEGFMPVIVRPEKLD